MSLERGQIIKQIEANIHYYSTHSTDDCKGTPGYEWALSHKEALQELLQQINEYDTVFDVRDHEFTQETLEAFIRPRNESNNSS